MVKIELSLRIDLETFWRQEPRAGGLITCSVFAALTWKLGFILKHAVIFSAMKMERNTKVL